MRRISFSLTTQQFRDRTKTVTRRQGWLGLKPGDHLLAVEKAMGLRKGERQVVLGEIEVVSVRREAIELITDEDVVREGFPEWNRDEFVEFYCQANGVPPMALCTRIEFRYVDHRRQEADRG